LWKYEEVQGGREGGREEGVVLLVLSCFEEGWRRGGKEGRGGSLFSFSSFSSA